jgi:hypothetical protein
LLDDGILIVAAACLCGATAYFFHYSFLFYLINATVHIPSLKSTTAFSPYAVALRENQAPRNIFAFFNWTAIYAIKLCFFTFFKPLIRNFRALTIFYWVSVLFTVVAWFAAATSGWFFTLYANRPNAPPGQKWAPNIGFTVSLSLLDIISDIMSVLLSPFLSLVQSYRALTRGISTNDSAVVSIPILLLRHASLKLITKIGICSLLGLSSFMIICVVIRMAGFQTNSSKPPDTIWRLLWQLIEACVAVMMASLTAFRALLVQRERANDSHGSSESMPIWCRGGAWGSCFRGEEKNTESSYNQRLRKLGQYKELPAIPLATFAGMERQIRRKGRDGLGTLDVESVFDPYEADYNHQLRESARKERI